MSTKYDDAVIALYRAPLDKFVAERKRLASELKASGDKAGATRLAGLARPPISAWTVNQLYWGARETFDELFAAGERLRHGDLGATVAHREAMATLRARAEALLEAAGHASTEATLRRIMTDVSALAAAGSFDPDPPGALAGDREPPGFDTFGLAAGDAPERPKDRVPATGTHPPPIHGALASDQRKKDADAARERQERERAERERLERERREAEAERARKRAERERLEAALRRAKADLDGHARHVDRLRNELAAAEKSVAQSHAAVSDLESRLGALD